MLALSGPTTARRDERSVDDTGGWGGITLAHNLRSPEQVDALLADAREAGAVIAREGRHHLL